MFPFGDIFPMILFNIFSLMFQPLFWLVVVLHMVESVLIYFSGHIGAVPAFFRDRTGRVVGGFTLQKFWPIPITALAFTVAVDLPPGALNMPEWWPLVQPGVNDGDNLIYTLIPVVAALGYGDMAIARDPRRKSKMSAGYLALYSAVLLALAVIADRSILLALTAALFSPLGHELVIGIGRRLETENPPYYVPSPHGLAVLDVVPDTPAWYTGLRSGDVIVALNGVPVHSRSDMAAVLYAVFPPVQVDFLSGGNKRYRRETLSHSGQVDTLLGVLPVPDSSVPAAAVLDLSTTGPAARWWSQFWDRWWGK